MTLVTGNGETDITGPVVDQAQLHGLLDRIRDLGLELVSVSATVEPAADLTGGPTADSTPPVPGA